MREILIKHGEAIRITVKGSDGKNLFSVSGFVVDASIHSHRNNFPQVDLPPGLLIDFRHVKDIIEGEVIEIDGRALLT